MVHVKVVSRILFNGTDSKLDRHTVTLLSWLLNWEILFPENSEKNQNLWLLGFRFSDSSKCFLKPQSLLLRSEPRCWGLVCPSLSSLVI